MGREELVKKLHRICSQYPDILGRVILFGSYSRGEEGEASDIDLYIEPSDLSVTTAKIGSSKRYKEFKYSLYDSFDNEFDLMTYGGKRDLERIKKTPLWEQIVKDGVLVYDQRTEKPLSLRQKSRG